jgi:hypothetical protein
MHYFPPSLLLSFSLLSFRLFSLFLILLLISPPFPNLHFNYIKSLTHFSSFYFSLPRPLFSTPYHSSNPYPSALLLFYYAHREGWVDYLELSKRTDFNPSTTTFFWFLDKTNLEKTILEHSYQAVFNLRSR